MHCTSAGKVILAYLPKNEVHEIIQQKGLPRHTESTLTDESGLLDNLSMIRQQGFGIEREENEPGITCIAAPIFNDKGVIVGAVSISGPSIRMTEERINELKGKIMEVGANISHRLDYKG